MLFWLRELAAEIQKSMGAQASKGAGVAATTVRRALPKAGDAAAVTATTSGRASTRTQEMLRDDAERQLKERQSKASPRSTTSRDEHAFFRPMAPNDGNLAPVKPAEIDVQKMVGEKDQNLVKRMDQLAGNMTMSRLEISGHVRAREIAEKRRTAQEGRLRIKTADARDILRKAAANPARFDVAAAATAHGTDEATVVELMRWFEDADAEDLDNTSPGAPPGSMLKVKRTRAERAADDAKRSSS